MKKAISYIRFSTKAQGDKGRDSTIRQKRALDKALEKHKLELDQEFANKFIDKGKSGFKQKHIQKGGAMYELRKLAVEGKLKGKVLVVEGWTRVGRMQPMDALPLLTDILNNGVDLVVGEGGGDYFSRDNINKAEYLLLGALQGMKTGFLESDEKAKFAREKYQSRMEALAKGEKVALNNYPFWIAMKKDINGKCTGEHYEKPDMVELVKKIFALYLSGIGTQQIAGVLNKEGVQTPAFNNGKRAKSNRGWYQGRVLRLIQDRAVLGYCQDKKNNTEYKAFKPIISEPDFYTANNKRKERICFSGRRAEYVNPFSGLMYCAKCNGRVTSKPTGDKNQAFNYFHCRYHKDKDCGGGGIRIDKFEHSFWGSLSDIDGLKLGQNTKDNEVLKSAEIQGRINAVENKIDVYMSALGALDDPKQAPSIGNKIAELEQNKTVLKKELEAEIIKEKGTVKIDEDFINNLYSFFEQNKLDEPAVRLQMQEALRAVVDKIMVDTQKKSYVVTFKNSPQTWTVQFKHNGRRGITGWERLILNDKNEPLPTKSPMTEKEYQALQSKPEHIANRKKVAAEMMKRQANRAE